MRSFTLVRVPFLLIKNLFVLVFLKLVYVFGSGGRWYTLAEELFLWLHFCFDIYSLCEITDTVLLFRLTTVWAVMAPVHHCCPSYTDLVLYNPSKHPLHLLPSGMTTCQWRYLALSFLVLMVPGIAINHVLIDDEWENNYFYYILRFLHDSCCICRSACLNMLSIICFCCR